MWNTAARLLGVRGADIAAVTRASLRTPATGLLWSVLLTVAALGIVIGVLTYARTTEPIAARKRLFFSVVRLTVYLLLVVSFSGLVLELDVRVEELPRTLVLVDHTRSMGVAKIMLPMPKNLSIFAV